LGILKLKEGAMDDKNLIELSREVISKYPVADVATVDSEGYPHIRPMYTLNVDDNFTVYFATGKGLPKTIEIEADHQVGLSWTAYNPGDMSEWKHVMLKGIANVTDEERLRHELWSEALAPYFLGKDDPNYVIIVVQPVELLYTDQKHYPSRHIRF
jgi:general stress protein 26